MMGTDAWIALGATAYAIVAVLIMWAVLREYRKANGYDMDRAHQGIAVALALLWPLSMIGTVIAVLIGIGLRKR